MENTPRKVQLSRIDTPISVTRTRILPPVPPTPITGQRRRSLPEVPPLPAGIDRYKGTPVMRKKITTSSESTPESVNRMRKLPSIPPSSLCVDSTLNKTSLVSVSLPEMEQTSPESAPKLVRWLRQLPHAQADTIMDNAAIDQMVQNQSVVINITTENADKLENGKDNDSYRDQARLVIEEHLTKHEIDSEIDSIINQYLNDSIDWDTLCGYLVKEKVTKEKVPQIRKGPLMVNRKENRNTKRARIYRFTQRSYVQNRKATVNKILDGSFTIDNETVTPKNRHLYSRQLRAITI